jgi:hypothetical protein
MRMFHGGLFGFVSREHWISQISNRILSHFCVWAENNLLTGKIITEIGNLVKLASIDLGT